MWPLLLTTAVRCEASTENVYRFVITATMGQVQAALGEIELLNDQGQPLFIHAITNPGGRQADSERAEFVADGNVRTKWIDLDFLDPTAGAPNSSSTLVISLVNPSDMPHGYRFYTANDHPKRDPISALLEIELALN